ncbi:hypothetical protein [Nitrosospira briensis]|uniref:hypothetical protein n=1 Tax=Nitrosospira briensis TaxID=35799 RepID=UPI0012E13B00|nr:hypothetical protein [Nitrosospira briensis]
MSTLEERVLEAIEATNLPVPALAKRVGVTVQAIYDWKRGLSLGDMKARFLYEGKGVKKKMLTQGQVRILQIAEHMEDGARENWIAIGTFLASVNPISNTVDTIPARLSELKTPERRTGAGEGPQGARARVWHGRNDKERRPTSGQLFYGEKEKRWKLHLSLFRTKYRTTPSNPPKPSWQMRRVEIALVSQLPRCTDMGITP